MRRFAGARPAPTPMRRRALLALASFAVGLAPCMTSAEEFARALTTTAAEVKVQEWGPVALDADLPQEFLEAAFKSPLKASPPSTTRTASSVHLGVAIEAQPVPDDERGRGGGSAVHIEPPLQPGRLLALIRFGAEVSDATRARYFGDARAALDSLSASAFREPMAGFSPLGNPFVRPLECDECEFSIVVRIEGAGSPKTGAHVVRSRKGVVVNDAFEVLDESGGLGPGEWSAQWSRIGQLLTATAALARSVRAIEDLRLESITVDTGDNPGTGVAPGDDGAAERRIRLDPEAGDSAGGEAGGDDAGASPVIEGSSRSDRVDVAAIRNEAWQVASLSIRSEHRQLGLSSRTESRDEGQVLFAAFAGADERLSAADVAREAIRLAWRRAQLTTPEDVAEILRSRASIGHLDLSRIIICAGRAGGSYRAWQAVEGSERAVANAAEVCALLSSRLER